MNITETIDGEEVVISNIASEDEELKDFLFSLGCYSGEQITVVSKKRGSYVLSIKDARYNIDEDLAKVIEIKR